MPLELLRARSRSPLDAPIGGLGRSACVATAAGRRARRLLGPVVLSALASLGEPSGAWAAVSSAGPGEAADEATAEKSDETALPPASPIAQQEPPAAEPPAKSPTEPITIAGGGKNYLNLALDALLAAGGTTASDVQLVEPGGHDPNQDGFTIQNVEVVFSGAVDPYFTAQANVVLQMDAEGETIVELEEAYATTSSLPDNLQAKAGMYLSEFGRLNPQHPHSWDFVDVSLVNADILGADGLRNPGARLSWLMPVPVYSEIYVSVQDSQGETAQSFRWVPGEEIYGRPIQESTVHDLADMLYVPRWSGSFDLTDNQTLVVGASGAFGPNATGQNTSTHIYGTDLFWKWKAPTAQAGFPFVKSQTEVMLQRYQAGAFSADEDGDGIPDVVLPRQTVETWGAYTQMLWGFRRGWVAGLRGDYVTEEPAEIPPDSVLPMQWRASTNLTWYPTEFSRLRLQYNHDDIQGTGGEDSVWLQFEFLLGAHAAHKF